MYLRETTIADLMPLIMLLGVPIMIGGAYLVLINPLLKKIGLKDSAEDKLIKGLNEDVEAQGFWSPTWYKLNGGNTLVGAYADGYADQLYQAMRGGITGWGTDESSIGAVFTQLGTKGNISRVAESYAQLHQSELLYDLKNELNDEEFALGVANPITKFPSYNT
jgi:hypothetical protein